MSKLKKAMEKAKEARATGVSPYPAFRPQVEKGKKASCEIDVTYSCTKVLNIDHRIFKKNKILSLFQETEATDQINILRTQVLNKLKELGGNSLLITSANPGEGKTFTSINVEGGGGGGGCFIATAVYGSPMHPHVEVLREFRDRCLLATTPGKGFVDFYYNCSPPISDFIAKHNFLKVMVRCSLLPIVGFCYASLHFGITNAAIILFLVFVLSVIFFRAFLKTLYSRN